MLKMALNNAYIPNTLGSSCLLLLFYFFFFNVEEFPVSIWTVNKTSTLDFWKVEDSTPFSIIYHLPWLTGDVPDDWRLTDVIPTQ